MGEKFIDLMRDLRDQFLGKVDKVDGKGLSSNDYTTIEKNKLSTIEQSANNYTHPASHPVAIIDGKLYPMQFVKTDSNGNTGWGYVIWGEISGKPATYTPSAHSHNEYILATQIGSVNGVCPLGIDGLINPSYIGALNMSDVFEVADEASMLALSSAGKADFAIRNDLSNAVFMLKALPASTLANWVPMNFNANVVSVNGKTGTVVITKADVGLGNADNTSDADKPISVATQAALETKQPIDATLTAIAALVISANKMIYATGSDTFDVTDMTAYARALLGNGDAATMRTALEVLSSTEVTTAINAAVANIVASSPAALDTLNELAAALGNDANFATTVTNALALKAPLASPALTGSPTINGINISPYSDFKNYIINGNFEVWQYGTSQTSSGYGSDDRWTNVNNGSTKTHSRIACTDTERALFDTAYFSRTVVTSVSNISNYVVKQQSVEDITRLAGKTVTLSFWARADSNKNFAIEFQQFYGTGGTPSEFSPGIDSQLIPLTSTWQKYSITTTLPSLVGKTLGTDGIHTTLTAIRFWFDAGSNYNVRAASLGQQSGTFDIAQVQIEEGSVATPFENRPYGLELSLCQRYYEEGSQNTYVPVGGSGYIGTTASFKVEKRVVPTIVIPSNLVNIITDAVGTSTTSSSYSIAKTSKKDVLVLWVGGGTRYGMFHSYTASAEL